MRVTVQVYGGEDGDYLMGSEYATGYSGTLGRDELMKLSGAFQQLGRQTLDAANQLYGSALDAAHWDTVPKPHIG